MHSAFNVLVNKGFLHNEGINTLEAIQKFYVAISATPRKPGYVEKDLLDFCPLGQSSNLGYQPVVILAKNGENHAVALKKYSNDKKELILTLIDSAAKTGETTVKGRVQNLVKLSLTS